MEVGKGCIAILGPGAIGGMIATRLMAKGLDVAVVGPSKTLRKIKEKGIQLKSETWGDSVFFPKVYQYLGFKPSILLITCKANQLNQAKDRVKKIHMENVWLLPLLNGYEHFSSLRDTFPESKIITGVIGKVEVKITNGVIYHSTLGAEISVHSRFPEAKYFLENLFEKTGINCQFAHSEEEVIYKKLTRLSVLAGTTAATGLSIGKILQNSFWSEILQKSLIEACAVSASKGYPQKPAEIMRFFKQLPFDLSSSLARDVEAGHLGEADHILGSVIRAAVKENVKCPTIEYLLSKVLERVDHCQKELH